jgi:head-tail adaptor
MTRALTQNEYGENITAFAVWREPWAESWVDRGAEPVQGGEPQSAPIRNFRVDWGDVYLSDPDGTVIREDMVIEVEGENYLTPDGVLTPRRYDIMVLKPDWARRSYCGITCKERRNHQ